MPNLLIVDDDEELASSMTEFFKQYQFNAEYITHSHLVIDQIKNSDYQLIILDKMLDAGDGAILCQEIRTFSSVPIIMLTGVSDITEHIVALECGADDYLVKPFSARALLARVRALLKFEQESIALEEKLHLRKTISVMHELYTFQSWQLNTSIRRLCFSGEVHIPLSGSEYQLLLVFLQHSRKVLSREQLLTLLDREQDVLDRTIDMLVSRLRAKLQNHQTGCQLIQTVRQGGYLFNTEVVYSLQADGLLPEVGVKT